MTHQFIELWILILEPDDKNHLVSVPKLRSEQNPSQVVVCRITNQMGARANEDVCHWSQTCVCSYLLIPNTTKGSIHPSIHLYIRRWRRIPKINEQNFSVHCNGDQMNYPFHLICNKKVKLDSRRRRKKMKKTEIGNESWSKSEEWQKRGNWSPKKKGSTLKWRMPKAFEF